LNQAHLIASAAADCARHISGPPSNSPDSLARGRLIDAGRGL